MCTYVHVYILINMYIFIFIYMYICVYVCTYIYTYVNMYALHVYTHTGSVVHSAGGTNSPKCSQIKCVQQVYTYIYAQLRIYTPTYI